MMPDGISECRECGVPIVAYGGGICDYCAFYTGLRSAKTATRLSDAGRHRLAYWFWLWTDMRLDLWRRRERREWRRSHA